MEASGPDLPRNYRAKALAACLSMLRLMKLVADAGDGDMEAFAIYMAVIGAGAGRIFRDPERLELHAESEPIPANYYTPVSRRAIAASVGLPRETVRRKVAALIETGLLVERDGGVVPQDPVIQQQNNLEFALAMVREFERMAGELARLEQI